MGETYTTIQGDTWDSISYKLYGTERRMGDLIVANWDYLDILVFPAGVVLTVPPAEETALNNQPFWRSDDAEESGYYEYEVDGSENLTDTLQEAS